MAEPDPSPSDPTTTPVTTGALVDRVQGDLRAARLARDQVAAAALRSLHAALQNAEAPPIEIGGAVRLDGTSPEAIRHVLDAEAEQAVVRREVAERTEAAATYRRHGQDEAAARVEAEVAVLEEYRR
ncbi:MAG: GatB/YqeY domain-containing protein [Acidimicrobiales bacterium]